MKRIMFCMASLLIIFVSFINVNSQKQKEFILDISVNLVIDDSDIKSQLNSYLSRELRKLENIRVVSQDANYTIYVTSLETKTKGGLKLGFALSVVVIQNINTGRTLEIFTDLTKERREALIYLLPKEKLTHNALYTTSENDLPITCKEIVISIDGAVFESSRKINDELNKP